MTDVSQWTQAKIDAFLDRVTALALEEWAQDEIDAYLELQVTGRVRFSTERIGRRDSIARRATPAWADRAAIKRFYAKRPHGHEVDHIFPLQGANMCGLHVLDNLQYLPTKTNRAKGAKEEELFAGPTRRGGRGVGARGAINP